MNYDMIRLVVAVLCLVGILGRPARAPKREITPKVAALQAVDYADELLDRLGIVHPDEISA